MQIVWISDTVVCIFNSSFDLHEFIPLCLKQTDIVGQVISKDNFYWSSFFWKRYRLLVMLYLTIFSALVFSFSVEVDTSEVWSNNKAWTLLNDLYHRHYGVGILCQDQTFDEKFGYVCKLNCSPGDSGGPIPETCCHPGSRHFGDSVLLPSHDTKQSKPAIDHTAPGNEPVKSEANHSAIDLQDTCRVGRIFSYPGNYENVENVLDSFQIESGCKIFNYIKQAVIDACLNPQPTSLLTMLPVQSKKTLVTYRNVFCRRCNEPTTTPRTSVFWSVQLLLNHDLTTLNLNLMSLQMYSSLDYQDMSLFLDNNKFDQQSPSVRYDVLAFSRTIRSSDVTSCKVSPRSQCNVTGSWDNFDGRIEEACRKFSLPVEVSDGLSRNLYRNLACAYCNAPMGSLLDAKLACSMHDYMERFMDTDVVITLDADQTYESGNYLVFSNTTLNQAQISLCQFGMVRDVFTVRRLF